MIKGPAPYFDQNLAFDILNVLIKKSKIARFIFFSGEISNLNLKIEAAAQICAALEIEFKIRQLEIRPFLKIRQI